ncbi:MAG: hypothetical protein ABUL60_21020 [Myxococcales bacterium]
MSMRLPQWLLLLLALCLLCQLLPADWRSLLVSGALAALPIATRWAGARGDRAADMIGSMVSALALCGLALVSPEIWLQASLATVFVLGGGWALGSLRPRAVVLALALGVLAPLMIGIVVAVVSVGGKALLKGELGDWHVDFASLRRFAQWLAVSLASLLAGLPPHLARRRGWADALAVSALALVVVPRMVWLASTLTLPTDLLIWSEPPPLLNLWKIRAGQALYGPFAELTSYSYSPALEHVQYGLLRPLGLELSLRAHRALGVVWQLLAALCLVATLARWLEGGRGTWLWVLTGCAGLLFSTLLAPHLHPDHLLMLGMCVTFWLVADARPLRGARLGLLIVLPALATMVKLTGAGIGLGLCLAYAWERDWRTLAALGLAGLLALATIPFFDALFGNFTAYAIRLQASHPIDTVRAASVWATPPLLCFFVASLLAVQRLREDPQGPAARAAIRVVLLTCGVGLTSLAAYAKHGGRDNSLLPFTLGGAVALLIASSASEGAEARSGGRTTALLLPTLAAVVALVTPLARPVLGERRAELVRMHETIVAWLGRSERQHDRVFSMSTAAYLEAGWRRIPDASLETIAELALAKRPEVASFEARIALGHYDALMLSASSLRLTDFVVRLLPTLKRDYVVVGPAERRGEWPPGLGGYVIAERRIRLSRARDIGERIP